MFEYEIILKKKAKFSFNLGIQIFAQKKVRCLLNTNSKRLWCFLSSPKTLNRAARRLRSTSPPPSKARLGVPAASEATSLARSLAATRGRRLQTAATSVTAAADTIQGKQECSSQFHQSKTKLHNHGALWNALELMHRQLNHITFIFMDCAAYLVGQKVSNLLLSTS